MIIGITGGSGSGKSTLTNMLNQKIENSLIIYFYDFMHNFLYLYKDEIIKTLGLENMQGYWYNYLGINFDYIKTWVKIIENDIEESIKNRIEENSGIDTFIVDWAFLPLLDFFNKCDYTISITCDLDIKLNRLKSRLAQHRKLERWYDDALMNRLKFTSLNELGYQTMYSIDNSGNINDLDSNINRILKRIRKG